LKLFGKRSASNLAAGVYQDEQVQCAVVIRREKGRKPALTDARSATLSSTTNPSEFSQGLSRLAQAPVTLVLPDQQYQLMLVEAPRVEPSELRAAIRWKVKNLIDFHIDDAVIDVFEIPGQQNRPQGQTMMYAVAARAREIRQRIDEVEAAGANLAVIDLTEMALRNLAQQLDEDARGVGMLYLDERHGVITLSRQGSLYLSRHIETGSQDLVENPDRAFDQIVLEVQRSLDYYDSHFAQPPLATLRILPGFAAHETLLATLGDSFNTHVGGYNIEAVVELDSELTIAGQHTGELLLALGGALRYEEISL